MLCRLIQSGPRPHIAVTDTIGYYTACEPILRGAMSVWTGCYAGVLTLGIESNGDVKGCSCLPQEFVAGNVRQRSLADIWADESRFAYNTDWHEEQPDRRLRGLPLSPRVPGRLHLPGLLSDRLHLRKSHTACTGFIT